MNFYAACRIAYLDPAIADEAAMQERLAQRDADEARIDELVQWFLEDRAGRTTLAGDDNELSNLEDALQDFLEVGLNCKTDASLLMAAKDLVTEWKKAATREAGRKLRQEQADNEESAALAAWEARCERCDDYA